MSDCKCSGKPVPCSLKEAEFVEWIKDQVSNIESESCDPEVAHSHEDRLRAAVLQKIADGDYGIVSVFASQALKTDEIDFARWCA